MSAGHFDDPARYQEIVNTLRFIAWADTILKRIGIDCKNSMDNSFDDRAQRFIHCFLSLFYFCYQQTFYDQKRKTYNTGIRLSRHNENDDSEY